MEVSSLWQDFKERLLYLRKCVIRHKIYLKNQLYCVLVPFQQFINGNIDYSNVIKFVRHFLITHYAQKCQF